MANRFEFPFLMPRRYRQLRGQMSWSGNKGLEDNAIKRLVRSLPRQGLQSFCVAFGWNISFAAHKKMANSEELAIC